MLEKVIRLRCRHDINVTKSGMILSKILKLLQIIVRITLERKRI